jgi:hypothetical protein
MTDVLPSLLDNFDLELCFLTRELSPKTWEHVLTIKIDKIVILSIRSVSQIGQINLLD